MAGELRKRQRLRRPILRRFGREFPKGNTLLTRVLHAFYIHFSIVFFVILNVILTYFYNSTEVGLIESSVLANINSSI